MQNLVDHKGRGVVLIRNPYESVNSHWSHYLATDLQSTNYFAREHIKLAIYEDFAISEARYDHMRQTYAEGLLCCSFFRIWFDVVAEWITLAPSTAIVFYEDVKKNSTLEVSRVFETFKIPFGKNERRKNCLARMNNERSKRVNAFKPGRNDFPPMAVEVVDQMIEDLRDICRLKFGDSVEGDRIDEALKKYVM